MLLTIGDLKGGGDGPGTCPCQEPFVSLVLEVSQMTLGQGGRYVNSGRQLCSHTKGKGEASKRLASCCVHYAPHSRRQPQRPGRAPPLAGPLAFPQPPPFSGARGTWGPLSHCLSLLA